MTVVPAGALAAFRANAVVGRWLPSLAISVVLSALVAGRWWATRAGLDAVAIGAAYGAGLLVAAAAADVRRSRGALRRVQLRHLALGAAVGLGLVALTFAGAALSGVHLLPGIGRPAGPFISWALVTVLVASAQERLLRGALFDRVRDAGGVLAAIALTTLAFALIHVPLYGWHVVPLDLAVGLVFAGLRLRTGGIAAAATAHTVADLATWWL